MSTPRYEKVQHLFGAEEYPRTADGRYFVVRGRLWRCSDPSLPHDKRDRFVATLMTARRAVRAAKTSDDSEAMIAARHSVDLAKHALGERGPVWWADGAPDYNRHLVRNTPYADWYANLQT